MTSWVRPCADETGVTSMQSDAMPASTRRVPDSGKYVRTCWILKRAANVSIGIAAGGIPWTIYDFNGYGPSAMFGGFVLYLILMDVRRRLILASEEDEGV
jgi:hypothetical protein